MDDDKLKSMFTDFQPELSSDFLFMNRLRHNMESVEIVKRRVAAMRTRNRRAVAVAAFVGFIVGFLFSLSLPYLNDIVADWQLTLPEESVMNHIADYFTVLAWGVTGATAVLAAVNTYDMMTSRPIPAQQ